MLVTDVLQEASEDTSIGELVQTLVYSTKHLRRIGNPRLYNHPYQSTQSELWPTGSVEWYLILRAQPYGPRRKKRHLVFLQLPLLKDGDGTQG